MTKKQDLIIVHGWNGSKTSWKKFIDLAEDLYNIHFISLPCFDGEPCPDTVWGIQEYANFLKKEIEAVKKEVAEETAQKPILLAHSFGGQIASLLVSQQPEIVSRLVLCGAATIRPKRTIKKLLFLPLVFISRLLQKIRSIRPLVLKLRSIIYRLLGNHDHIEAGGVKQKILEKVIREDLSSQMTKIVTPTIILWGRNDTYTPIRQGHKLTDLIRNSKLYIQKNGKHGLHITHPQWILNKINL